MKLKLTTTTNKTPDQLREALHDALGHNADRLLVKPSIEDWAAWANRPMPTITPPQPTPHWRDKKWEYIPSTDHLDSTKFRERMEKRRIAAQGK